MARQNINIGTVANDGTGDDLRIAMQKVNDNFTELYGASPVTSQITISGNKISSNATNANLKLTASGTGVMELEGIQIRDNHIETTRSNDNLILSASGTGSVVATKFITNQISSDDSSAIQINDGVNISGTLSANTIDTNVISSSDSSAIQINDGVNISGSMVVAGFATLGDLTVNDDTIRIARDWSDDSTRSTSIGIAGDQPGLIAWGDDYIYVCTGTYNGSTAIWKRAALSTF